MDKTARLYVSHMLDAINNIESDIKGLTFEKFRQDRRARQLVERNLEILSEASRRIPNEMKLLEAEIPWKEIAGIGNILRHEYHQTYPTILWDTCQNDLESLKKAMARMNTRIDVAEAPGKVGNEEAR